MQNKLRFELPNDKPNTHLVFQEPEINLTAIQSLWIPSTILKIITGILLEGVYTWRSHIMVEQY